MTLNIIHLLPFPDTTLLSSLQERIKILKTLQFLCKSAHIAIKKFLSHHYTDFDAQVSENLCQIRAYYLIDMISNRNYNKNNLTELLKKVDELEAAALIILKEHESFLHSRPSKYVKPLDRSLTLQNFLNNYQISIELDNIEYFLIQAYILSRYKLIGAYEISHGIDYNMLCDDLRENSKTYAKKLVHRLQRNLSQLSCQFIFRLLSDLELDQAQRYLLKSLYFTDEIGRHVIGGYEVTRLILKHALQEKSFIRIQISQVSSQERKNITFLLQPSACKSKFVLIDSNEESCNESQMLFVGIVRYDQEIESEVQYIHRFMEVGFENIILSNMAQHPQYAGLYLDNKKYNPYQHINTEGLSYPYITCIAEAEKNFLWHKNLSRKVGCIPDNSHLFLLTHVRCAPANFGISKTSSTQNNALKAFVG